MNWSRLRKPNAWPAPSRRSGSRSSSSRLWGWITTGSRCRGCRSNGAAARTWSTWRSRSFNGTYTVPRTSRRSSMPPKPDPVPVDAITGLLAACATHQLVALGEAHWLQQEADFIAHLFQHPNFPSTVQVIVVEFGNAYYQPVIDRFVAG